MLLSPSAVIAQDMQKVHAAMALLKSKAQNLGPAKIEGTDTVDGKTVPAVLFGNTKMNNNFTLVDEVAKEAGGTATIFVKSGADYLRVATNVKKDDGSRASALSGPSVLLRPDRYHYRASQHCHSFRRPVGATRAAQTFLSAFLPLQRFEVSRRKRGLGCCNRQPRGCIGYAT
jgi:hypothetical protein